MNVFKHHQERIFLNTLNYPGLIQTNWPVLPSDPAQVHFYHFGLVELMNLFWLFRRIWRHCCWLWHWYGKILFLFLCMVDGWRGRMGRGGVWRGWGRWFEALGKLNDQNKLWNFEDLKHVEHETDVCWDSLPTCSLIFYKLEMFKKCWYIKEISNAGLWTCWLCFRCLSYICPLWVYTAHILVPTPGCLKGCEIYGQN